jgi:peptidoglycan/xylan/chitin deacetylase (PgdA/CDA1 family)
MYHYVEPLPAGADDLRRGLTVTPEDFAAQMQYLADRGYTTVSLYDLVEALALGRPLPEKAVVLTFDDGYRSLLDYALPVMQPHAFTGTVFVITEFADRELPQYLTWPQLRELAAHGWRIEPHGKTHTLLAGASRAKQIYEMLGAIESVEAHLGVRPRFFCYPSGKFDELTLKLAQEMHLWGAVTTRGGRQHRYADRFTWSRVRVDGRGTLEDFVNALEGDVKSSIINYD